MPQLANHFEGRRLCVRRNDQSPYEMFRATDSNLAAIALDPYADRFTNTVADALAEYVDLFDQDGALLWATNGKTTRVTPNVLAEIIPKHLATKHLVTRGDKIAVEYIPLVLDPQNLRPFFSAEKRTGSLLARATKV
jgi:hypothetical protein